MHFSMIEDIVNIRRIIEFDVFDYQVLTTALVNYRKPRDKITRLFESGTVIRIKKGLYCFSEEFRKDPLCREYIANLIFGPSYISLEYALAFHGLIPERVSTVTSVTTRRSRKFDTPVGAFSYQMMTENKYSIGADLVRTGKVSFLIATPEKALVDKIWNDKRLRVLSVSDFESYLLDDLRIDPERLSKLGESRLLSIANMYNSAKINNLVTCILNLRSGAYA